MIKSVLGLSDSTMLAKATLKGKNEDIEKEYRII